MARLEFARRGWFASDMFPTSLVSLDYGLVKKPAFPYYFVLPFCRSFSNMEPNIAHRAWEYGMFFLFLLRSWVWILVSRK